MSNIDGGLGEDDGWENSDGLTFSASILAISALSRLISASFLLNSGPDMIVYHKSKIGI